MLNRCLTLAVMSITGIAAACGRAEAQAVSITDNKFGLEILSAAVDTTSSTAKIVVRNTSGKTITAYVTGLEPVYSDGERPSEERPIDFFLSMGLARVIPESPGTDANLDAIAPGMSRENTFLYQKPEAPDARLVSLRAGVTGVFFGDETTAGDSRWLAETADQRDAWSAEILRWCADIKQFSGVVTKKAVEDMLAAHMPHKADGRPAPGQGATEAMRQDMSRIFQRGLTWLPDGTATLDRDIYDVFSIRCANAEEHLKKRGLSKTQRH